MIDLELFPCYIKEDGLHVLPTSKGYNEEQIHMDNLTRNKRNHDYDDKSPNVFFE